MLMVFLVLLVLVIAVHIGIPYAIYQISVYCPPKYRFFARTYVVVVLAVIGLLDIWILISWFAYDPSAGLEALVDVFLYVSGVVITGLTLFIVSGICTTYATTRDKIGWRRRSK